MEFRTWRGALDTTLCDKVCQLHVAGRWSSPGSPVSSINKIDLHDITEILLKITLTTIFRTQHFIYLVLLSHDRIQMSKTKRLSMLAVFCIVHVLKFGLVFPSGVNFKE